MGWLSLIEGQNKFIMKAKQITLTSLIDLKLSVSDTIEAARKNYLSLPERLSKPFLKNPHTSESVMEYAKKLEVYESQKLVYDADVSLVREHNHRVNCVIEEYIKEITCLNMISNRVKVEKIWNTAYERGHSDGFYEVYLNVEALMGLDDIF